VGRIPRRSIVAVWQPYRLDFKSAYVKAVGGDVKRDDLSVGAPAVVSRHLLPHCHLPPVHLLQSMFQSQVTVTQFRLRPMTNEAQKCTNDGCRIRTHELKLADR